MNTSITVNDSGRITAIKGECKASEFRTQIKQLKEALKGD